MPERQSIAAAIALLIKRPQRNTDQREEARDPAERRACKHDIAIVQHEQDADEAERKPDPLHPRHRFAHEAVGDGRRQDRLETRDQCGNAGRDALADGGEYPAQIEPVHQRACDEAVPDLACIGGLAPPMIAIAAMITTTKTMRTARKVSGSI